MTYVVKGATGDWLLTVGLEIHCQLLSKSKLFSGASAEFGAAPNQHVDWIDAAFPGMMPALNGFCVDQAIKTGLGLNASINRRSVFDRKSYFYADLPAGYQITQNFEPIISGGFIEVDLEDGSTKKLAIERAHLEQDAGKSMHDQHPAKTLVDLNRAGVTLLEIVTKPVIESPEEVGAVLRKLRSIVRYLGTCDGNMDEGSMRCDVNVSVRRAGTEKLGTRVEVKNVNSVKFAMAAVEHEARRQVDLYEAGESFSQETRLFDSGKGETRSMRSKEFAEDYRYYHEPDLLPLIIEDAHIEAIRKTLPELPDAKKSRFINDYGLSAYDASVLVAERETAQYYEDAAKGRDAKKTANWVTGELFAMLKRLNRSVSDSPVRAENLGKLVGLIDDGTISGKIAKEVFALMETDARDPAAIVAEKGLKQVVDTGAIDAAVASVLASNPDKVAEYRAGKEQLAGWFVGQAMKATGGKANPAALNDALKKALAGN